jgi:hypothetical protein
MSKTKAPGERPDASISVTGHLRRLIARRARKGETVGQTLRRLFQEKGYTSIGKAAHAGRMLLPQGNKTTLRLPKALKAWIIGHMTGFETLEHAIRRMAGLAGTVRRGTNGR